MTRFLLAFVWLSLSIGARAQYLTVSGSALTDSAGIAVSNATITFTPVLANGKPLSFRKGSTGGQTIVTPVSASVNSGAFTIQLVDSSLTTPSNTCYSVSVVDNISGVNLLGGGYNCVQPSSTATSWCSVGGDVTTCNFDAYQPNLAAQAQVQYGPQGPPGPPAPIPPDGNLFVPSSVKAGTQDFITGFHPQHRQNAPWWPDTASPAWFRKSIGAYITVDGAPGSNLAFSDSVLTPPPGEQNVHWQIVGSDVAASIAAPIPGITLAPAGLLLCAKGSDTTISALSVTSLSLSGTTATIGVGSSPSAAQYMIGQTIGVLGVTPSGLNGQYQITAISGSQITATALGSQSGSYSSGGTVYMPCLNSTDATTGSPQGFTATLMLPAAAAYPTYYSVSALFATWTTATVPSMVVPLLQMNGSTIALWNGVATGFRVSAAGVSASEAWSLAMPYNGKLQASSDRQTFGSVTGSGQVVLTNATTSSSMALTLKSGFAPAGVGGGATYSSGASGCTDGTQAVTFTNGAGTGGTGTITVSGGVPSGALTVTNTGYGYTSQPTQGTVATCSGTATFSGGSLGGAQGNALWLMLFRAQQQQ